MNIFLRLILFISLAVAGQSYATTAMSYGYVANTVQPGVENLNNNGLMNPSGCCSKASLRDSQDRAQARAFFALVGGFDVPKGTSEVVLPGMNRPVRSVNPDYPPSQSVVDAMSTPKMKTLAADTGCIDCSEIAPKLLEAAGGKGQILEVRPNNPGTLNVFENGVNQPGQYYHQVYTDGRYVYDPRLSSQPIPKGDWEQHIRNTNPGGITISTDLRGLQ